jgi:hypothetical protein
MTAADAREGGGSSSRGGGGGGAGQSYSYKKDKKEQASVEDVLSAAEKFALRFL